MARCITHERSTTCGRRTSGRTMGKRTGRATAVIVLASNNLQRRGQAADNGRTTGKQNQQHVAEQRVAPANKKSLGDFEGEANSRRLIGGDQRHETIRRLPLNMERARTLNGIRIQSESTRRSCEFFKASRGRSPWRRLEASISGTSPRRRLGSSPGHPKTHSLAGT